MTSCFFFFSSRRRHTRCYRDWSSDVCSSDLSDLRLLIKSTRQWVFVFHQNAIAINQVEIGILLQQGHLLRQMVRTPVVIGVEKRYVLTAGLQDSPIASAGGAPSGLFDIPDLVPVRPKRGL